MPKEEVLDAPSSRQGTGIFEPWLDLATPELYDRIAFRLLELPVQASERDVDRRRELMEKAVRNRLAVPPGGARVLPRAKVPDEHEVREAAHAIQDAERRLAHEFFWFWPLVPGGTVVDEALRDLAQGNDAAAVRLWQKQRAATRPAAQHNLALLHHIAALQLEQGLLEESVNPAGADASQREARAEAHWREATRHWEAIASDEALWSCVTARIRALADSSLTTGAARRMQRTLPIALTLVHARLAMRALSLGKPQHARRHVARLRASALDAAGVEDGLRRAVEPIRTLLKSLCEEAERNAKADPAHADAVTQRLLDQAATPLTTLDLLLPDANPARQAEHDQLAQAALVCQIAFGNETKNHKRSLELIDCIVPIAAGAAAKERLARDRAIVLENVETSLCWFCGQNPLDERCVVEVPMHGDVQRIEEPGGIRVRWSHLKVKVPKCKQCVDEDTASLVAWASISGGIFIAPFFGGFIAVFLGDTAETGLGAGLSLGIVCGLLAIARAIRRKWSRTAKRERDEFPRIKDLKREGWQFGEKPGNVQ